VKPQRAKKTPSAHTPMMAQYLGIKAQHPEAILLFRMGDFYETFYDDAKTVAGILGITLTSRERKNDDPIPLAGVPFHALEHYLGKLLDHGRTVAICEQMEDPSQVKGLVRREVVEILSPGTVTDPALLSDAESRWLMSLGAAEAGVRGYALLDGSTGEFRCGELSDDEIGGVLRRHRVAELLYPEGHGVPEGLRAMSHGLAVTGLSDLLFEHDYAAQVLREHFRIEGLDGLGLGDLPRATAAAGAALRYLADCQRSRPAQVQSLGVDRPEGILHLDRETVAHLELFHSLRADDRESTLFHHLDETRTPMGRRMLAHWMRAPLCDLEAIRQRHDAVEWLFEHQRELSDARDALRGMGDLSRSASRIATERAQPAELGSLRAALDRLPALEVALREASVPSVDTLLSMMPFVTEWCQRLHRDLVAEPPPHLRKGGVFLEGVDAELDELRGLTRGGKRWIADYQAQERERSGIPSLKIGYNRVFGYHIEVTNTHLYKVPDDYEEKQKLVNAKRFITAALNEKERQILRAEEDLIAREVRLFEELRAQLAAAIKELQRLSHAVAEIDTLCSLAQVASSRSFVRPTMTDGRQLDIEAGRHPVVERLVDEPFVPNDLRMDPEGPQLVLLTGPNMGGKSTYLRQTALFVLLAQMGGFVPAKRATIGLVDRLFTRVGASDDLARGKSTFLVEMAETANILRNATGRSLVILDEVGRGTSTDDGLALAWAISEYLHDGPQRPKTLFATHFHELTALADRLPRAANLQMQVKEWESEILFLHNVIPGASDRSYGVHVARLAGVPRSVLERAREILAQPEIVHGAGTHARRPLPVAPLPLFEPRQHPVLEQLRALNPDAMRPLDALQILAELRDALGEDFRD